MNDCGVCLASWDGETVMYRSREVKARHAWKCDECGRDIPKGSRYVLAQGLTDGDFWTCKTCLICDEIAEAFSCNGRLHGFLWEGMDDLYSSLTTACFERLQTADAKKELRKRWMDWRGL